MMQKLTTETMTIALQNLLYEENAPYIYGEKRSLFNEKEVKEHLRSTIGNIRGHSADLIGISILTFMLSCGSFAGIYTIFYAITNIVQGNYILSAIGLLLLAVVAVGYTLRLAYPIVLHLLLQLWFRIDRKSEDRLYNYIINNNIIYTGIVINVVNGYESTAIYFSYSKHKESRYFSKRTLPIGRSVTILHTPIVSVLI